MGVTRALAVAVAGGLVLPAVTASTAHAAETDVLFVHAFGDAVVDVYIDGDLVLNDLALDSEDNPSILSLPAGDELDIAVVPGDNDEGDSSTDAYLSGTIEPLDVAAASLVLTHGPDGPTIAVFEDYVGDLCDDEGLIVLRHLGTEPATVDLGFNGEAAEDGEGVEFGSNLAYGAPPGTYELNLWEAGTGTDAYGTPVEFDIEAGVVLVAYPYSDPETQAGDVLFVGYDVPVVACEDDDDDATPRPTPAEETPEPVPTSVPAGHAPGHGVPWVGVLAVAAAILVAAGAAVLRSRRA